MPFRKKKIEPMTKEHWETSERSFARTPSRNGYRKYLAAVEQHNRSVEAAERETAEVQEGDGGILWLDIVV